MKTQLLLLLCCINLASTYGQTIPPGRITDWSQAGFKPGYIRSLPVINVTDLGAANDSSSSVDLYITRAIDSFKGKAGIVFFPAGVYICNSPITLSDSITLKGAGSDSTKIVFDLKGAPDNCINIRREHPETVFPFTKVLSGMAKGSARLSIADTLGFRPEGYAEIREENGNWDTVPAAFAAKSVGQIVRIVSVSGSAITIDPALRIDLDSSLHPEIRIIKPITNVSVECMHLTRADSPSSGSVYNINLYYAVNCLISGVESSRSMGAHVMVEYCKNVTVKGSYFHHALGYDGNGTRGYGICLRQHSSDCLIENNLFRVLRHAMMVKEGANGNVFAYNYSREPRRSEPIADLSGDISLHGHYAFANLFESNVVQNIIIDHYWGPSGPFNTFFRNRIEGYGLLMTDNAPYTSDQNFAGNEVTNTTPLHGNYALKGTGHFEYGNNVQGTIVPAGKDSTDIASLYLATPPLFWRSGTWPAIGYPHKPGFYTIPAEERYNAAGTVTICLSPPPTVSNTPAMITAEVIQIFPNPFENQINIDLVSPGNAPAAISLIDMHGKTIFKQQYVLTQGKNQLVARPAEHLNPGLYLLNIRTGQHNIYRKVLRN